MGRKSSEIAAVLGYSGRSVLVHHNDLAWTGTGRTKVKRVQTKGKESLEELMHTMGRRAREAVSRLAVSSSEDRNGALMAAADAIRSGTETILEANRADMDRARAKGLTGAMLDRLWLDADRIEGIARGLESVAALDDPLGEVIADWERPNGLRIQRVRVPLGVIGIIYESRPNVTADAGALCLKSGNAAILRGGSESYSSSQAIHRCLSVGLASVSLPEAAVQLVPTQDREAVGHLLRGLSGNVDVVVPRGGKGLIQRVQKDARVPVIGHLEGICHVYVHESSKPEIAIAVTVNAKMRRTRICGAAETLLIDAVAADTLLPNISEHLIQLGCELRGDPRACAIDPRLHPASEQDWSTEYLDAILSVKVVDDVGAAIEHIKRFGSGHTEAIIAEEPAVVERFFRELDSAILLHNASTQFADGAEFGMGAEIGIATGRIHARGPVGAAELTSYKYLVRGSGQIRPA
ncbi:glutamate-5-semialdehyde dehydrogenase [soil metagenome]